MKKQPTKFKHGTITNKVIQSFYEVYNGLGIGFEKEIYKNGLEVAIKGLGLDVQKDKKIEIEFKGEQLGQTQLDLVVEEKVLLLVTSSKQIEEYGEQKLYNQLKASPYKVGLILNFGVNPKFKRKTNNQKDQGNK